MRARLGVGVLAAGLVVAGCASAGVEIVATPSTTVSVAERELPVVGQSITAEPESSDAGSDESRISVEADEESASSGAASDTDGSEGESGDSAGEGDAADSGEGAAVGEVNGLNGSLSKRAEQLAQQLFDLANEARADADADELEWADCAADQAEKRATHARGLDELKHQKLTFDCTAQLVGENLVRGDAPASNLHQLWMDSKGHKENILNEDFDRLGIGCVAHAVGDRTSKAESAEDIGGWVCSQMFYG
ncbi:CAP domain-containing protein [Demequina sp. NBRC 110056]|uniref:CAP domain-containing protein n=1 Tax=Demequina sp. NBRC 110056 TaxID=1570345 RepID=UPI00135658DF|nr:CAP domain-containing protein [Demequina sp. NBRC 110056]